MRSLILVACATLCLSGPTAAEPVDDLGSRLALPTRWLVAPNPDLRGRRPVGPATIVRRYLLPPTATPPKDGESLKGERGEAVTWRGANLDSEGRLDPKAGGPPAGWAYLPVQVKRRGVWIARARNAARLYVNGDPFVGDVYGYGSPGVPVALEAGTNHLYLTGFRGKVQLSLHKPGASHYVAPHGVTQPDIPSRDGLQAWIGVRAVNATTASATVRVRLDTNSASRGAPSAALPVCPLGSVQAALNVSFDADTARPTDQPFTRDTSIEFEDTWWPAGAIALRARAEDDRLLRTFRSGMDDSIQVFGIRPPTRPNAKDPGLVLSLHGAGVAPRNQVRAYGAKPDLWLVVPTNRAPFGFDWQDWGRADAYEVLDVALRQSGVSRDRVYLTGHSMGGHGAWHLAANDPDTFAAVAPCAAWESFDSYGGRPKGALASLWHAADGASRTLTLIENLASLPTFVLHGETDKTVPLREAQTMLAALKKAGGTPEHHFEPGKGHWYDGPRGDGADCVDWPDLFDLFRKSRRPDSAQANELRWVTVDAATDSVHHWLSVWQPRVYGKPMRIEAKYHPADRSAEIRTENVACFALNHPKGVAYVRLDGAALPAAPAGRIWFQHDGASWRVVDSPPAPSQKHPQRQGPLRQGMRKRFVFVYGTAGRTEENHALLARARFDAQSWMYRANGQGLVLTDRQLLENPARYADRDVVLYGNRDTNAAWSHLVASTCPVAVRRGRLDFGNRTWRGEDLGAAFVYPRADSDRASVVCLADTGTRGTRIGTTLLLFVSGAGFPDYLIYGPDVLVSGDAGVLAAGWFDAKWQIQPGGHLR